MATSAFRSTTKRSSTGSSGSAGHRSRSLSRLSRPVAREPATEAEYNRITPRGKFVNTSRGSAPFPEVSLDDLALELFYSSSMNENESDGMAEREGRSVRRRGEVGRWASDTASSSRRGRSVSKTREVARSGRETVRGKNVISAAASSQRRRSLSVVRFQMSDSENEVDHSQNSSNASVKALTSGGCQKQLIASNNRRIGRSRSRKDLSGLHDGYSSHSSALTDDEAAKDNQHGKNGNEKIIQAVFAQKKTEHPSDNVAKDELYKAMQREIRCAVAEIRTELNQTMRRNQALGVSPNNLQFENCRTPQGSSRIGGKYAIKLEELEKCKHDLLTEMLWEEQQHQDIPILVDELSNSRISTVTETPSRASKRSEEQHTMSKGLLEEAERYFEEFAADISSFDGERSDGSSTLGGTTKATQTADRSTPNPVEMDGIILPWLEWEASPNGSPFGMNEAQTPLVPKTLEWDSEKEIVAHTNNSSGHSISSRGSWSPGILFPSPPICETSQVVKDHELCIDIDEYLQLEKNEELLFEMYREQNRINSGGLLLCTGGLL